jgi:putative inorganic carbon (hco3(-)) transporter
MKPQKIIFFLFALLFFFVPLILWPYTSEVFEFNKMLLTYALGASIVSAWIARSIIEKKLIFRRTMLDIPLLIFVATQLVSTLFSIDALSSWFGYYSRFNGGLLSTVTYSLLYWAYVSNMTAKSTAKIISILLASALLVCIYGILQHFGIDKNIWIQDVQSRIFSTLGQPNWLAAWLVALIPLTWSLALNSKLESLNSKPHLKLYWLYYFLSAVFFITILYTKSRSGLLGFVVASAVFWLYTLATDRFKHWKEFVIFNLSFVILSLVIGTQYSPNIIQMLDTNRTLPSETLVQGPALEVGGTESGTIRKIVWSGALDIWKNYPVFGTGVETFAFSYYKFRPVEHNLVSEWDFIYNKAHNEYLNMAANSGSVGVISYLVLILFSGFQIMKISKNSKLQESKQISSIKLGNSKNYLGQLEQLQISSLKVGILAGYVSLLVTNFFGFSVVPTQLIFFLFPAFAVTLTLQGKVLPGLSIKKVSGRQKAGMLIIASFTLMLFYLIFNYWKADTLYTKGKEHAGAKSWQKAEQYLIEALRISPNQAIYRNELATIYTQIALMLDQNKQTEDALIYSQKAIEESAIAVAASPANVNLKRARFGIFVMLSSIDQNHILSGKDVLIEAIDQAPTDPKLHYNLGLIYARTGQKDLALSTLAKTVELKSNYKEARLAYAILLKESGESVEAKNQLLYILEFIDPNDSLTKQTLEAI